MCSTPDQTYILTLDDSRKNYEGLPKGYRRINGGGVGDTEITFLAFSWQNAKGILKPNGKVNFHKEQNWN